MLQKLWETDESYQKLTELSFNEIGIRGVKDITINFNYPITAIAGTNGIGKTTILQTLACLFHNKDKNHKPYRFSNSKIQQSYYTFADFFVIARGENKGAGAELNFKFIKPNTRADYIIRKGARWSKYERRPYRHIDFLGISRVLPSYEFAIFKSTFSGDYTASNNIILTDDEKQAISNITSKNLTSIHEESCAKIQNFTLSRIASDGISYTSFNMGAGEEVAITLISRINKLPLGSLVLIEEIELGLHPKAQKKLIESIMKIVKEKKLQLVFTTHSPYIFDILPPQAKILLKKVSDKLEVIQSPSNTMAFIELTGDDKKDLTIYVEDEIAKQLVEGLFNSSISKRIQIIDVGSKENVVRMTSAHHINPELGIAIGIPDGDATDSEVKNWCSKYMLRNSENCTEEEFNSRLGRYFSKLPSDEAPEKYILKLIKENEIFISYIDDSSEFCDFIKNQIDISEDHHALFFKIAQFLSKDIEGVKRDILKFITKNYRKDFQSIISLIEKSLGSLGVSRHVKKT